MLRHVMLLAFRNVRRHTGSFLINITGLSVGLFCAILIYLWVSDEQGMDAFHKNADRLFVVLKNASTPDGVQTFDETSGLLASALPAELPEVQYAAAVIAPQRENTKGLFLQDNQVVEATDLCVSPDFFRIFSFRLLQGDPDQVFSGLSDIAISDELAGKLFHTTENVIGRTVQWNRQQMSGAYVVSGVFEKPSSRSTLQFDVLFNYNLFLQKNQKLLSWKNGGPTTYVLLKKGVRPAWLNQKISGYLQQKGGKEALFVQRFADRYLHDQYENGHPSGGRIRYVRLFSIIGILILAIACINFMNLATARSLARVKEVGVQKLMGAARRSLIVQYLGEALLLSFFSLLVALLFVWLLLPRFNELSGKQIALLSDANSLAGIFGITILTGLLAGSYPALYISGFKPARLFQAKLPTGPGASWVRSGLVVFQFAISVVLLVSVLVVYNQIRYIQTRNLGYDRDHVVYFERKELSSETKDAYGPGGPKQLENERFLQEIRNLPGVVSAASFRHNIAAGREGGTTDVQWPGKSRDDKTEFTDIAGGYQYMETLGFQLKEGRSYSQAYGNDKSKVVFNEAAVAAMGLTHPVGATVRIWGEERQIIGVVRDFHFQSLYETIRPAFIDLSEQPDHAKFAVKIKAGGERATLARLERVFRKYDLNLPFDYRFLDEDYQKLYVSENRTGVLSAYFTVVAIVISCLGLFGLASFTVQRRLKEMGIRRVLGSSRLDILWLLWREFGKTVLLGLIIGLPLSYWGIRSWLDDFSYRIPLSAGYFLAAAIAMILLAMVSVGPQALKATRVRPAAILRAE